VCYAKLVLFAAILTVRSLAGRPVAVFVVLRGFPDDTCEHLGRSMTTWKSWQEK
jgi:hypothetical protein